MKKCSHEKIDVPVEGYTKYIYTFVVMKPGDAEILRINRESDSTQPLVEVRYSIISHEPALRKKAANMRQLANNCNYVCVKVGQELNLVESFTSCEGYSWKLKDGYDKRVIKLIKDTYTKKSKPSHHGKAFIVCDRQCFVFKALKKGMTEIVLEQEKDLKNGGKSIVCKYYSIMVS
jgi:predicted secreted protein